MSRFIKQTIASKLKDVHIFVELDILLYAADIPRAVQSDPTFSTSVKSSCPVGTKMADISALKQCGSTLEPIYQKSSKLSGNS